MGADGHKGRTLQEDVYNYAKVETAISHLPKSSFCFWGKIFAV